MYGWSMIVVMCLNFFVNFFIVAYFFAKYMRVIIRKAFYYLNKHWQVVKKYIIIAYEYLLSLLKKLNIKLPDFPSFKTKNQKLEKITPLKEENVLTIDEND